MRTVSAGLGAIILATCQWVGASGDKCLIPYYTGTITPTPHKATYLDKFMPLGKVGVILGNEVKADDARLATLLKRLTNYDAAYALTDKASGDFDSFLCVGAGAVADNACPDAPPERPEGFLLRAAEIGGKPAFVLKGHDFHGLLWAITAFNQLVTEQDGKPVVRLANIDDYPDTPGKRAYTAMGDAGGEWTRMTVELARPNIVIYRKARGLLNRNAAGFWRQKDAVPEWKRQIKVAADFLNPLQIRWYDSLLPLSGVKIELQVRGGNAEDFQALCSLAQYCAENRGGFCLLFDDFRFPMHPDDVRDFGLARKADIHLLNKLYAAVKKDHPAFRLLFCPPFYWGPLSDASAAYGESRDAYLAALGENLSPDIDIYWTGPKVKSAVVTRKDVQWISKLIRRKPAYWDNVDGINHGGEFINYGNEAATCWKTWFYPGFFDDIAFFSYNRAAVIDNVKLFDALWNPDAYDPERSAREAVGKIFGPKLTPKFLEFCKILETMDHYGWAPNAAAAKNIRDVEEKTAKLEGLYREMAQIDPRAVNDYSNAGWFMDRRRDYLKKLKANPNLKELVEVDAGVKAAAAKDLGAFRDEDIVLTPNDFDVKIPPRFYAWGGSERCYAGWLYGAKTGASRARAAFRLTHPPTGDFEVIVRGLDHNAEPPCRVRILINDKVAFEGPNPFKQRQWTPHAFKFPGNLFHDNVNSVVIENIEDSDNVTGAPFVMFHYVVIRELKASKETP